MKLRYQLFPRSFGTSDRVKDVITCFELKHSLIDSHKFNLSSNEVLEIVREDLEKLTLKLKRVNAEMIKSRSLCFLD